MYISDLMCPECQEFAEPFFVDYGFYERMDNIEIEESPFIHQCTFCDAKIVYNISIRYNARAERIDNETYDYIENGDY